MRFKTTLATAAVMLIALVATSPVHAVDDALRIGIGVNGPYPLYPYYPYYYYRYYYSPNYYRGRDGRLYPAGPPAIAPPATGPQPRFLPNFRTAARVSALPDNKLSYPPASRNVPSDVLPPQFNTSPGQP
jgi:hypothetical protein